MGCSSCSWSVVILALAVAVALPGFLLRVEYPVPQSSSTTLSSSDSDSAADGSRSAILVTGTSTGIGRSTCAYLAQHHPTFVVYCSLRKMINDDTLFDDGTYPNIRPILFDVTSTEQVTAALQKIQHEDGLKLIGLVNNAGVIDLGTIEFQPLEQLQWIMDVNVFGTVRVTQAALPQIRQHHGRIVTVGSCTGAIPAVARYSAYAASKHALEAFSDSLRHEMAEHRVSVSLIQPGLTPSEMIDKQIKASDQVSPEEREAYPWLYTESKTLAFMDKQMRNIGNSAMEETLQAIDHALFARYPRTRYRTSWAGLGPTWLTIPFYSMLPDRFFDWLKRHPEWAEPYA